MIAGSYIFDPKVEQLKMSPQRKNMIHPSRGVVPRLPPVIREDTDTWKALQPDQQSYFSSKYYGKGGKMFSRAEDSGIRDNLKKRLQSLSEYEG